MNKTFRNILAISVMLVSLPSLADKVNFSEPELEVIESSKSVYEDKIDISYLAKMVIHPEDDWIGKKVFKHNGVCVEVIKDLKIKKIRDPFKNLYRSANLPKVVEIGEMDTTSSVVDCSLYESKVTVLE